MKLSELDAHLFNFTEEEELYKEYRWLGKYPDALARFVSGIDTDVMKNREFYIPELSAELNSDYSAENWYWHDGDKNIYVHKHHRYMPALLLFHSFFEIHFQYAGHGRIEFKDHIIEMKQGDVCIISPGTHHIVDIYDEKSIDIIVKIRKSTFKESFPSVLQCRNTLANFFINSLYVGKHTDYIYYPDKGNAELRRMLSMLYLEHYNMEPYAKPLLDSLLAGLLFLLMRQGADIVIEDSPSDIGARRMDIIFDYIKDNYSNITLEKLAKEFHFAEQYLSKYIKEHSGSTYSDIVRKIKLEKSLELLDTTNKSILDISNSVGYPSPENFMRLFKREYGITPTTYRKRTIR